MTDEPAQWGPPDPADRAVEDDRPNRTWLWAWIAFGALLVGLLIWALSGGDASSEVSSSSTVVVPEVSTGTNSSTPAAGGSAAPTKPGSAAPTAAPPTVPIASQPPATIDGVDQVVPSSPPVKGARVEASCTAQNSTDSRGNPVTFKAVNLLDGDAATAWRCAGSAKSAQVTVRLPKPGKVDTVGATAGWDHVDKFNKDDRYKENRRLVSARWECLDASGKVLAKVQQKFADRRKAQSVRATGFDNCAAVRLVVLDTTRAGRRDSLAVSEIVIS